MIRVDVCVDQEANLAVTELAYFGHQVLCVRLELRVDQQHALFPDKDSDICKAIGPLNHVYPTGDGHGSEFHVEETVRKLGGYGEWR